MARNSGCTMTVVATSANPIQEVVLDAIESRTPLRISGRSHWMDAGRPVDATRILSTASHSGVVDYVPGDLTITIRGGTTLGEINAVTNQENQWFPLDPHGSDDGTIGATLATGSFGPLAHAFGRARDLVLGLEFVAGDGRVVRGGGRVVKNVAGFDLTRLMTGSWGTLGIVTEATLRLYSKPQAFESVAMSLPEGITKLAERIASILDAPVTPYAVELLAPAFARRVDLGDSSFAMIDLGGNAASVRAQRDTLARMGGLTDLPVSLRRLIRMTESEGLRDESPIVFRLSALPGRIAELWSSAISGFADVPDAMIHATPSLGIVRCIVPRSVGAERIQRVVNTAPGVTAIYERLPAEWWPVLSPSVISDRLSQGITSAFDPHRLLNPGILGSRI
jgi:glycolate oxidase FAD binding subunit